MSKPMPHGRATTVYRYAAARNGDATRRQPGGPGNGSIHCQPAGRSDGELPSCLDSHRVIVLEKEPETGCRKRRSEGRARSAAEGTAGWPRCMAAVGRHERIRMLRRAESWARP
jgi:hypothetical protein